MQRLLQLAQVLLPVVAVLAVGYGLRRGGIMEQAARHATGRLVFWVSLPALLIAKLSSRDLGEVFSPLAVGIGWTVFIVGFGLCLLGTRAFSPRERGSVISGLGRFNGAFVGLPVVVMWTDTMAPEHADTQVAAYLVLIACMAPLTQLLGILGILMPLHGNSSAGWRRIGRGLLINPLIWGCAVGLGLALCAPGCLEGNAIGKGVDLLGQSAVPLALLCAGASIDLQLITRRLGLLAVVSLGRLLAYPLAGWLLCQAWGLEETIAGLLVVLLACPTAASSVAIAKELGADDELMAGCVVATTVLAPLSLLVWLFVLTP